MSEQPRNPYLCLAIVVTLGTTALTGVIGMVALGVMGRETPPSLVAVVSTAIGALASFLVSVPRGSHGSDQPPRN